MCTGALQRNRSLHMPVAHTQTHTGIDVATCAHWTHMSPTRRHAGARTCRKKSAQRGASSEGLIYHTHAREAHFNRNCVPKEKLTRCKRHFYINFSDGQQTLAWIAAKRTPCVLGRHARRLEHAKLRSTPAMHRMGNKDLKRSRGHAQT